MSDSESSFHDQNNMDYSDESEDYEPQKKKRQKPKSTKGRKRLKGAKQFFEIDAISGDEEEVSEVDDEYAYERAEAEKLYRQQRQRPSNLESVSAEELAKRYEDRVADQKVTYISKELSQVAQQQRLPSVEDPKLWLVGCRRGKEKEAVINLMNKAIVKAQEGDPLPIYSAFASNHVRDNIYVEAFNKLHVVNAIKGMNVLYDNKITLVPISEMVDVFAMDKAKKLPIEKGSYVRIKSGDYKGDLAQIVHVEEHRGRALVKVVPRLEKTGNKKIRAPPKLFNPNDYPDSERKRDPITHENYYYWNGHQFYQGFLIKSMSIRSLQMENVTPSLAEVQVFQSAPKEEAEDQQPNIQARRTTFVQGDTVKVVKGGERGLTGTVITSNEDSVTLIPLIEELCEQKYDFPVEDLVKFFNAGDHVKVIGGRFAGTTGMVVASQDSTADVISDATKKVIKVLCNDLKLSDEIASANTSGSIYRVNDVVTLTNEKMCGLVLKVENDHVKAIMENSETRSIWFHEISKRFIPKKASAMDRDGNTISSRDMVKICNPKHEKYGKIGSVKNSLRGTVFLYMPDSLDAHKIVPVRQRAVELLGSERQTDEPELRQEDFIGRQVRITAGPYRGKTGRVLELLDRKAKIELSSENKQVTVNADAVAAIGSASEGIGLQSAQDVLRTPARSPGYPVGTPAHEMQSPSHWRDTPYHDWARSPSAHRSYK